MPYNQQQPMGVPSSVCAAAFFRPAANVHYVQSNELTGSFTSDPPQTNIAYGAAQTSSAFVTNTSSQILDAARYVDHDFSAVSLRSQPTQLRQDYICNYSPMSGSTPAAYNASGVPGANHLPADGWSSSAAVPPNSGSRSHHIPPISWQNMHQQADVELTASAGSVYSMAPPTSNSFAALPTSMQYSAVSSIGSPTATGTSVTPSPVISPYSPSVGKTYSDASGHEGFRLPLHMQPQYLESLLQLHYLLLASNKLQAPRYPASLAAHRFDSHIPGSMTSTTRPAMFDVNHLSPSPGSFQRGFPAGRFPRLALSCLND